MDNNTKTIEYYNTRTSDFFNSTVSADVTDLYERFLKCVPSGGRILDFGCGSGRDTKEFLSKGYMVEAIDGSLELCRMASEYTGIQVKQMDFFDLDAEETYDGIWACASILHVERDRLPELLGILRKALTANGVLYMSFKYGDFAGMRDERYFTDMNEELVEQLLKSSRGWKVVDIWKSKDVRSDKKKDWLNILLQKSEQ